MKVSKDSPLNELTLRKYEKPYDLEGRELVRKLCLSTGLLQPGDSRDVVVDILYLLLQNKADKKALSSDEIREQVIDIRKQNSLPLQGIAASNIRRQLKRLRDVFFVEKIKNNYRINEFSQLEGIFEEKVEQFLLNSILIRIKDYLKLIDKNF